MHRLADNGGELLHPVGLGSLIHSLLDMERERDREKTHTLQSKYVTCVFVLRTCLVDT